METPPARGRDAAILQRQLDATSGQRMHRRRVSRNLKLEDSFFTPRSPTREVLAPQAIWCTLPDPHQQESSSSPQSDSSRSKYSTFQFHNGISSGDRGLSNPATHDYGGIARHSPAGSPNLAKEGRPDSSHPASNNVRNQAAPGGSPSKPLARALGSRRRCAKCSGDISGHFVRALGEAYHISCFTCEDCDVPCAAKFFPVDSKPLCEHCYFKRQNLLCYRCGNSLRGSYITALDRKYHVEHFTCSLCTTVFGPDDSYFEYHRDVYCRAHYSSLFAFHCEGCKSPILKQFVETYRGGKKQQWHPECYMIFKFWSVKITDSKAKEMNILRRKIAASSDPTNPLDERASEVIAHEELVDNQTLKTWTTVCGYEESCAREISELVQNAVNGDFRAAYKTSSMLVAQIRVLFGAMDLVSNGARYQSGTSSSDEQREPGKEAKTLCRKVVSAMSLLSKTRDLPHQERMQGLAKDLLALASAIAHYLKVLIRQGLSGALAANMLDEFLNSIGSYAKTKPAKTVSPFSTDHCRACGKAVEDKCFRQRGRSDRLWHAKPQCFKCTRNSTPLEPHAATVNANGDLISKSLANQDEPYAEFTQITKLEQYVILLYVALARLDLVLSNKRSNSQESSPRMPKSHAITENTSASTPVLAGQRSDMANPKRMNTKSSVNAVPTALERTSTLLHEKAGLTLDEIRRIVAAEQAKSNSEPHTERQTELHTLPSNKDENPDKNILYFGMLSDEDHIWIRYIAQALLQPYSFKITKRELDTVSISPKTPTLWGRMGKVFIKDQEGRVFGQPLERLVSKYGVDSNLVAVEALESGDSKRYTLRIPSFVDDCVNAMRHKDMSAEGVFRKNGNIRRLREFVDKIDKNPDENGLLVDENPIQLAALLKKFLRDLPDPLLCAKLSPLWTSIYKLEGEEQRKVTQLLVSLLPRPNRSVLEVLVYFLNWVSSFAHVDDETGSKMDIPNLATVLGPTLVLPNEEADAAANPAALTKSAFSNAGSNPTSTANIGAAGAAGACAGGAKINADSYTSFKNVSEPVKLLITDFGAVAQLPDDIVRCLNRLRGTSPRKLSYEEVQDLLK